MAAKKKTGATRKPARSRPKAPPPSGRFRIVMATALRGIVNMALVATVSATVLGGLLAVKHFGV